METTVLDRPKAEAPIYPVIKRGDMYRIARETGISPLWVWRVLYRQGAMSKKPTPRLVHAILMAEALGMTLGEFYEWLAQVDGLLTPSSN